MFFVRMYSYLFTNKADTTKNINDAYILFDINVNHIIQSKSENLNSGIAFPVEIPQLCNSRSACL